MHIAAEDFVSEQALWIRGWKHQGRLEATVESRALLLSKEELKVVLQDYVEILVTWIDLVDLGLFTFLGHFKKQICENWSETSQSVGTG